MEVVLRTSILGVVHVVPRPTDDVESVLSVSQLFADILHQGFKVPRILIHSESSMYNTETWQVCTEVEIRVMLMPESP
jgi:hypothetical protein